MAIICLFCSICIYFRGCKSTHKITHQEIRLVRRLPLSTVCKMSWSNHLPRNFHEAFGRMNLEHIWCDSVPNYIRKIDKVVDELCDEEQKFMRWIEWERKHRSREELKRDKLTE